VNEVGALKEGASSDFWRTAKSFATIASLGQGPVLRCVLWALVAFLFLLHSSYESEGMCWSFDCSPFPFCFLRLISLSRVCACTRFDFLVFSGRRRGRGD
jgi:hypothetical protein